MLRIRQVIFSSAGKPTIYVLGLYRSDRHTLLILVCGSFWAVAGLMALPGWLAQRVPQFGFCAGPGSAIAWPLLFAALALPKTLQPLHEYRSGFREVGHWLAEHTRPIDKIDDPLCWAHYYAGRVFLEGCNVPVPPGSWSHERRQPGSQSPEHPISD